MRSRDDSVHGVDDEKRGALALNDTPSPTTFYRADIVERGEPRRPLRAVPLPARQHNTHDARLEGRRVYAACWEVRTVSPPTLLSPVRSARAT